MIFLSKHNNVIILACSHMTDDYITQIDNNPQYPPLLTCTGQPVDGQIIIMIKLHDNTPVQFMIS